MNEPLVRTLDAKVEDVDSVKRTVVARINTSNVDRFNTVILARGGDFQDWHKAGSPVLWEHGKDPRRNTDPIANSPRIWNNGSPNPTEIVAQPIFLDDDFSEERFEMYRKGIIRGWSVNILPDLRQAGPPTKEELRTRPDWEGCELIYRKWSLAEFSGTTIPGNVDAVTVQEARGLMAMASETDLWLPDEARAIYEAAIDRAMTGSTGGLPKGGALARPDRRPEGKHRPEGGHRPEDLDRRREEDERRREEDRRREDERLREEDRRRPREDPFGLDEDERAISGDEDEGGSSEEVRPVPRRIIKEGGKYYVTGKDGKGRLGGPYDTREEALKRLDQVEYFKHKDEGRSLWTIRDRSGRVLAMYPDETTADESLVQLVAARPGPSGYERLLARLLAEQQTTNEAMALDWIGRMDLRFFGKV